MFDNLNSTLKKVVVIFLIITLTYANLVLIGTNIVQGLFSYALEETEEQNLVVANQELVMNKVYGEGEDQKRIIQVAVETGIESEEYPIKASTITLGTDIIEATLADVKVTELNKNSYTTGTWEVSEEGKLVISLVNENETLESKEFGLDKFLITYVFENSDVETIKQPLENLEIKTYSQEVFTNQYVETNFEDINIEKELLLLNIENKDIHKTTIESGKVDCIETLNLDLSYRNDVTNITIEDVSNDFYNVDGQKNEEVTLKYNKTIFNKENLSNLLGETGKLVITDKETSKELITLTKEMLAIEESEKQYYGEGEEQELRTELSVISDEIIIEYSINVANLKIELIDILPQSNVNIDISDFVIENTKSILNVDDIENLSYLEENLKYIVNEEKIAQTTINFKDTVTRANLTVDNIEWIVGEINTVNYTITLDTTTEKSELFKNPIFIIELPSSVESINTENSEFTVNNDSGAFTDKKVFTTTVLGKKYVVVTLIGEQTAQTIENGNTTVNLKLELVVNESEAEGSERTKIYYRNDTVTAYESGKGFDTVEIDIQLIMQSEEKEEVTETVQPEQKVSTYITTSNSDIVKPLTEIEYTIYVENNNEVDIDNAQLMYVLPEGVTLKEVVELKINEEVEHVDYNYNIEDRTLMINLNTISDIREFKVTVIANELPQGVYKKEIKNSAKVKIGENVFLSNEIIQIVSDVFLLIETTDIQDKINENEQIIFEVRITNKGLIDAYQLEYTVNIPEEIELRKVQYGILGETEIESTLSSNEYKQTLIDIPREKTYFIKLTGRIGEIDETKEINVNGAFGGEQISWDTEIENIPKDEEEPIQPDGNNPGENNPDGNNPDGNNPDGNNPGGNKPNGTNQDGNQSEDRIDGFDLSLTQYLNKVTVENAEGTTVYEYTDTNFAKVEIHSKNMNGSKVTLEYKMIVKNEGTIPGYARKIVNYKPEGLEFNQDLNKDWYVGDDGNIYSITLIEKLLNPGETAELTILLTKQMTNDDGGTIKNTVELYEASNDENVEDINSIPGDKLDGQNDMSTVEVIIAVKTGTIILYITLATAVIAIIGVGFYKIKKVTLIKKGGC